MKAVLAYLRSGMNRKIDLPEFTEFWKACNDSDRASFIAYAESQGFKA